MRLSLRTALVLRMATVLLFTIAVVGVYTYTQLTSAAEELSQKVIRQTSSLIDQRIAALLDQADSQSRLIAGIVRPTVAEVDASTLDSRNFPLIAAQLVELAKTNPEFGAASLTLDKTGEYVRLNQTSGSITVQTTEVILGGEKVVRSWRPFGDRLQETNQTTTKIPDPRLEEAYKRCKEQQRTVWVAATDSGSQAQSPANYRVICANPILTADGKFLGVVTVTLTLDDLSRFLLKIDVGESGYTFLVEINPTGNPYIIADPASGTVLTRNPDQLNQTITQEPVRTKLLQEIDNNPVPQPGRILQKNIVVDGRHYLTGITAVSANRGPQWAMVVVAPQEDFLASTRQTVIFFITFGALALGVGSLISLLLGERLVRPLRALARETARIRNFELEETPRTTTHITEIDELSSSVETMKSGLRSMEKLVPTEYARHLISSGQEAKLGGERRHISTSFGDIVGFTRLSHKLPPEELIIVLSEYLEVLSNEVLEYEGTLDKFNGDDVMAFWGAPTRTTDHALMSVKCALASLQSLENMHTEWQEQGRPILSASFGIATGDVIVGNVGNKQRMNYTVIGDSVNLASRLQSLNRFYQTHILISHQTANECEGKLILRLVDIVAVFNRAEPVLIYEPLGETGSTDPKKFKLAELHNTAMTAYQKGMFTRAAQLFQEVLNYAPNDGPASVLRTRCLEFEQNPPPDNWNGAHQMTLK